MEKLQFSKKEKKGIAKIVREGQKEGERFADMTPERQLKELDLHLANLVKNIKNMREGGDDKSFFSVEDLKEMLRNLMEARAEIKKKLEQRKSKLP